MKNLKFIILISIILPFTYFSNLPPAFGQEASSASQLRDSVKIKVAEELAQIKKAVSKKAFLGTITAKNEATLTLSDYLGRSRSVMVSTDTVIKLKNGSDGTPADLKSGDYILVLGDVDSNGNMTAKRLLVITSPATDKRTVIFGKVSATGSSITVDNQTAKLASDSTVTSTANGKTVKLKTTNIKIGNTVVLVTKSGTSVPVVTDLYILPSSSPSATTTP